MNIVDLLFKRCFLWALICLLQLPIHVQASAVLDPGEISELRDSLMALDNARHHPDRIAVANDLSFEGLMLETYRPWLEVEIDEEVSHLASRPISTWLEAAYLVYFYTLEHDVYLQARRLYEELELRQDAKTSDARRIVEMSIGARDFAYADNLIGRFPELNLSSLPLLEHSEDFDHSHPAILRLTNGGSTYEAKNFTIAEHELRLIFLFHPRCGFSQQAAEQLQHLEDFNCFSSEFGSWIAPMHFHDDSHAIQAWNDQNPDSRVDIVYFPSEWEPIRFDQTPQFVLMRGREIISHVQGWIPEETPKAIKSMLMTFKNQAGIESCGVEDE